MNDMYKLELSGDSWKQRTGSLQHVLQYEKDLIKEFKAEGYTVHKHVIGFTARHIAKRLTVDCDIRKVTTN